MKNVERRLLNYLPIQAVRTHDSDPTLDRIAVSPSAYDFSVLNQFLDDLRGLGPVIEGPSILFNLEYMPQWLADSTCSGSPSRYNRPTDYAAWGQVVERVVAHIKQRMPNLTVYYEVWNEPQSENGFWMPCEHDRTVAAAEYFKLYEAAARAVKRIDRTARVGGPAIAMEVDENLSSYWIDSFLSYCQARSVPLDFVSYHRYEGANLTRDLFDGARVRAWLSGRGMNNVEIINSEWNWGGDNSEMPPAASAALLAAALPARYSMMAKGSVNRSFVFQTLSPELITGDEKVSPAYNVLRMLGALKGQQVYSETDGLSPRGQGVGVWSAVDVDQGFMILVWNYQHTNFSLPPEEVSVNIESFPLFLVQKPLVYRRYLVDAETSNWLANPSREHLEMVDQAVLPPSGDYQVDFSLEPNSVTLLVFCPQGGLCAQFPSPATRVGPRIRDVFVDWIKPDSARITWTTDRPATSQVDFGTTRSYGQCTPNTSPVTSGLSALISPMPNRRCPARACVSDEVVPQTPLADNSDLAGCSDLVTSHAVTLAGLNSGTMYYFRVRSTDTFFRESTSEDWWSFQTPAPGRTVRIIKTTDDTFLDDRFCQENPQSGFGRSIALALHAPQQRAFVKFNIPSLSGRVEEAKVRLFGLIAGEHGGRIHSVPNTNWTEDTLNCSNEPPMNAQPLAVLDRFIDVGTTYDFLLPTGLITEGPIAFGFTQPARFARTSYASKESRLYPPPVLVITTTIR
jgi:hypothetical protein